MEPGTLQLDSNCSFTTYLLMPSLSSAPSALRWRIRNLLISPASLSLFPSTTAVRGVPFQASDSFWVTEGVQEGGGEIEEVLVWS